MKQPTRELIHGDCFEVLQTMESNSVDAVVTDPPYGLSFMGKNWDYDVPPVDLWREVCRVLKPGGHLLSFGGTRTYHRMVVNIEDGGFEIRDQIQWLYGSGFPKSLDVSKAIDKAAGEVRPVVGVETLTNDIRGNSSNGRGISGPNKNTDPLIRNITAPATPAAAQWSGWGTALKPANEPICVGRKPFKGTVVKNVLEHGTGALNIDGCRIEGNYFTRDRNTTKGGSMFNTGKGGDDFVPASGRWPANVILTHSPDCEPGECSDGCPVAELDRQSAGVGGGYGTEGRNKSKGCYGDFSGVTNGKPFGFNDTGTASRCFYVAKASAAERGEDNRHPTVKPVKLMSYLIRLVSPPGGTVLDPFMGSGTTGIAAHEENVSFIGIEKNKDYFDAAVERVDRATRQLALAL